MKRKNYLSAAILAILQLLLLIPILVILYETFFYNGSFSIDNLLGVFLTSDKFHTAFSNSVIYSVFISLGQIILGILIAYVFAFYKFKGKEVLWYSIIFIMILPIQSTLVQTYSLIETLDMTNQYIGVILPGIFYPIGIIFLRQYFERISMDVINAGQIDGAGGITLFFRIILPMSKNGICLLAFLSFIDSYNVYELPLILLRDYDKKPLSLIIRDVIENHPEEIFSAAVLYMIPAIIVFVLLKDSIISGLVYNENED